MKLAMENIKRIQCKVVRDNYPNAEDGLCPCQKCDAITRSSKSDGIYDICDCDFYRKQKENCRHCEIRKNHVVYAMRYEWVSPVPEFSNKSNTSGKELFIGLSISAIKCLGSISTALVFSYLHFVTRNEYPDEDGKKWKQVTHNQISEKTTLNRRTVLRAISDLKDRKLIEIPEGDDTEIHWKGNWYSINYENALKLYQNYAQSKEKMVVTRSHKRGDMKSQPK